MRGRMSWLAGLVTIVALGWAAAADAETLRVTRTNDPNPGNCAPNNCSLREAVLEANASIGQADRIVLPNARRAYRLTRAGSDEDGALNGDLDVTNDPLTITHRGQGKATIDAGGLGERIFETFEPVVLDKLVLTGGKDANDDGGAILAAENLRITNSVLRNNRAADPGGSGPGLGGAIYHNGGVLKIVRSKLIGNRADDEAGAIEATGGKLVIKRSVLSGNRADDSRAGAIYTSTDVTVISRSTFANNEAPTTGGALYVNNGLVYVADSTFLGNKVTDSDGGAILSFGSLSVTNSTFTRNRASGDGGAIYIDGEAAINAATIARNVSNADNDLGGGAGGGVYSAPGSDIEIANSILAFNDQRGGDANDCSGLFDSFGGNLRTDGTDCPGFNDTRDAVRANARIGGPRRNGGPTKTIALKPGSPAIGRAIEGLATPRDQRGRDRDSNPDSGAFERGA